MRSGFQHFLLTCPFQLQFILITESVAHIATGIRRICFVLQICGKIGQKLCLTCADDNDQGDQDAGHGEKLLSRIEANFCSFKGTKHRERVGRWLPRRLAADGNQSAAEEMSRRAARTFSELLDFTHCLDNLCVLKRTTEPLLYGADPVRAPSNRKVPRRRTFQAPYGQFPSQPPAARHSRLLRARSSSSCTKSRSTTSNSRSPKSHSITLARHCCNQRKVRQLATCCNVQR